MQFHILPQPGWVFLSLLGILCSRFYQNSFSWKIILNQQASVLLAHLSLCKVRDGMCGYAKLPMASLHLSALIGFGAYSMHVMVSQCTAVLSLGLKKNLCILLSAGFNIFFLLGEKNLYNVKNKSFSSPTFPCSLPVASIFTCQGFYIKSSSIIILFLFIFLLCASKYITYLILDLDSDQLL